MHRIDSPGATADGRFKETPLPAARVDATWLNSVQESLVNIVAHPEGGGMDLEKGNDLQVLAAILALVDRKVTAALTGFMTLATDGTTGQRTITFANGLVVLKMGYFRETIVDEVTRAVVFATPFPAACWNVWTEEVIAAASDKRDLWVEIIPGLTTRFGFTAQFQENDTSDSSISGFDWWAFGN